MKKLGEIIRQVGTIIGDIAWAISDWKYERRLRKIKVKTRRELAATAHNSSVITKEEAKIITALLKARKIVVSDIMTNFTDIVKLPYNLQFTPKLIDDLYRTGHKVFPVIDETEQIIGSLRLADEKLLNLDNKTIGDAMRGVLPTILANTKAMIALKELDNLNADGFLVEKDNQIVGLITLSDLLKMLAL